MFLLFHILHQHLESFELIISIPWHAISIVCNRMIRISTRNEPSRAVVTIDGRLTASDLGEVVKLRQSLQGAVVLEVGGLDACDDDSLRFLRDWLDAGAQLGSATPFLRMVLEDPKRPTTPQGKNKGAKGCDDSKTRIRPA